MTDGPHRPIGHHPIVGLLTWFAMTPGFATDQPPALTVVSKATGEIVLSLREHSPLYAEVENSPSLSAGLVDAMTNEGFVLTNDKEAAKARLVIRGDIAIVGGPTFVKGTKTGIGDAVEKSLQTAQVAGGVSRAEMVHTAAAVAINDAAIKASISPFWRGLAIANMASVLGEATGLKGKFNTALVGDPRGICLSRCEDWNKVNQTVYLWITLQTNESKKEIRVLAKALSEKVAPDELLERAMSDGIVALKISGKTTTDAK